MHGQDPTGPEVVDALPVRAGRPPTPATWRPAPVPVRQAAALAATSFVAGAATAAVVVHRRMRPRRRRRGPGAVGEIVSSSSFLIDVHRVRRDS